jgi:hypothetical protein
MSPIGTQVKPLGREIVPSRLEQVRQWRRGLQQAQESAVLQAGGYGSELAQRGYVVVAPDYPSFGQQKDYDFKTS